MNVTSQAGKLGELTQLKLSLKFSSELTELRSVKACFPGRQVVGSVQADNMKQEIDRRLIIWNIHRRTIRPTCNLLGVTEHQCYLVSYHGRIEAANMNNTIVTIVCVTILGNFLNAIWGWGA